MKAYQHYKDSAIDGLANIPSHWVKDKLKFVGKIRYGLGQPPKELENGIPIIRATNVERGRIVDKAMLYIDPSDVPTGRNAFLQENEIIVVRSGAYTADSAIITRKYAGAVAGYDMVITPTGINAQFLSYALLSPYILRNQLYLERMRAAQPHLNAEELGETNIVIPPFSEQQAIVEFLNCKITQIDTLIEKKQRQIDLLQEQRTALINQAVTKGLNPDAPMKDSGVEWLGKIPSHWEVQAIKRLAHLKSGENIVAEEIEQSGPYPVYGGNGLRGFTSKYTHQGDFVLIGRQGALCGNINYAYRKFWASEHAVVATPKKEYKTIWFGELLRAMNLNQYSMAAAQPGLAVERINNLQIPVPPVQEQEAIENFLTEKFKMFDKLIRLLGEQIELYKEYRTALISEAVTGKIDVR